MTSKWADVSPVEMHELQATMFCRRCEGTGEERIADAAGDMDTIPCVRCGGGKIQVIYPVREPMKKLYFVIIENPIPGGLPVIMGNFENRNDAERLAEDLGQTHRDVLIAESHSLLKTRVVHEWSKPK